MRFSTSPAQATSQSDISSAAGTGSNKDSRLRNAHADDTCLRKARCAVTALASAEPRNRRGVARRHQNCQWTCARAKWRFVCFGAGIGEKTLLQVAWSDLAIFSAAHNVFRWEKRRMCCSRVTCALTLLEIFGLQWPTETVRMPPKNRDTCCLPRPRGAAFRRVCHQGLLEVVVTEGQRYFCVWRRLLRCAHYGRDGRRTNCAGVVTDESSNIR